MENESRESDQGVVARVGRFGPARLAGQLEGRADRRPPLVLLHGLTFDRSMWRPALDALRRRDPGRQVLALDLPGHGDSPEQPSYALHEVAEMVSLAVEDAGLATPVIVGHSIAAIVSTIYAARHPTRGVVNVDQPLETSGFLRMLRARAGEIAGPGFPAFWDSMLATMRIQQLPEAAQRLVRSTMRPRQHLVNGYWRQVLDGDLATIERMFDETLATLRQNKVPYLFVAGSQPSAAYVEWLGRALPQATITVVPNGGHFPHLADADAFAASLAATAHWGTTAVAPSV